MRPLSRKANAPRPSGFFGCGIYRPRVLPCRQKPSCLYWITVITGLGFLTRRTEGVKLERANHKRVLSLVDLIHVAASDLPDPHPVRPHTFPGRRTHSSYGNRGCSNGSIFGEECDMQVQPCGQPTFPHSRLQHRAVTIGFASYSVAWPH